MIVIDTSAFMAMVLEEPEADAVEQAIVESRERCMGAPTVVEASLVVEGRKGPKGRALLDSFIVDLGVEVVPFDVRLADRAREAWRRWGTGRHPAALNFGDCLTYAVAAELAAPILCVGNDFARTDAEVVALPRT